MAKFVFKVGKDETQREGDRVSIGTRSTCSFTLDDPLAADVHCDIVLRGDEFVIIDRGSSLGTYVGGLPVEAPRVLKDGDEIVIAVSRIKVQVSGDQINLAVDRSRFNYDDKTDALDLSRREVGFGRFRPVSVGNWMVAFSMILLLPLCYCGPTSDILLEPGPTWHDSQPAYHAQLAELGADLQDCNACHSPFDRNLDGKCMTCHEGDLQRPMQHPMYESVGDWELGCNHCHIDHRGAGENVLIARPAHESCGDCHDEDQKLEKPRAFTIAEAQVAIGYNSFAHADHAGKKLDPNGRELVCDDCHVAYDEDTAPAQRVLVGDRSRDYRPVDYAKCLDCHNKEAPTARAFEGAWHGTEPVTAGEPEGQRCLACHTEVNDEKLRMIADFDAERHYVTVTRSHDDQLAAAHKMADGRACADCHRNGAELKGARELPLARFGHGVHIHAPWPADQAAMARFSGNPDRPGKGECVHCHAATAKASTLLTDKAQEYANQSCQSCHTSAAPLERITTNPAPDRVDFPHDRHLKVEGGCYACHTFPSGDTAMMPETPLDVRNCMKCHQEHDSIAGGHCDDCHKKDDPAMKGETLLVTRTPDRTYDHMSPGHRPWTEAGRCTDCHGEDIWKAKTIAEIRNPVEDAPACRQCHVEEKARFHWR